jgi:hypothetical protein
MQVVSRLLVAAGAALALALPSAAATESSAPEAAFERRSYAPGELARLVVWRGRPTRVRVYRVGGARGRQALAGEPVTDDLAVHGTRIGIRVGDWPSGLYDARLSGAAGGVGHATFVVRPRRLGSHRIAVVLPTNTWQAYNRRDVDRDGVGDTWYESPAVTSVDLTRPFLDAGVPPYFRGYDRGFLRWLALTGKEVDVLADDDLERVRDGAHLVRLYDLVVFPGHEEYVTTHAYDVIRRYRDLGGNLAFLSANNVFYRVERRGSWLVRTGRWRDLGRPEAALTGAGYVGWSEGRYPNTRYVVTGAHHVPWLFRGSGLRNGDAFGVYGIEIDARSSSSPPGTRVLARIAGAFGPGRSAEMTYYTTPRGAKVFSAGVLNFGGSALWPTVSLLLENLWAELSRP